VGKGTVKGYSRYVHVVGISTSTILFYLFVVLSLTVVEERTYYLHLQSVVRLYVEKPDHFEELF
jgi:hypothetical protein